MVELLSIEAEIFCGENDDHLALVSENVESTMETTKLLMSCHYLFH